VAVVVACTFAVSAIAPFAARAGASTDRGAPRLLNWDPKLASIAAEVEAIRGLKFDHAVPVHYLAEAAFQKRLLGDDDPTPNKTRTAAFQRTENLLRALGLLDQPIDLHAATRKAVGADTLAFYDPSVRAVYVRGTDTTAPATRVTLAHELTHALQDQHFNLIKMQVNAAEHDNSTVVKAVIEGDATYVQNQFAKKLGAAAQQSYQQTVSAGVAAARAVDVPQIISVEMGAPYALGEGLVTAVRGAKGVSGENALFAKPPTSELALVDPSTVIAGVGPVSVATPKLASGEKREGRPTDLGAFGLFTVVASRLPASNAITTADLWRGDRLVQFQRDGRSCVRVDIVGKDAAASQQIRQSLAAWTAASGTAGATATDVALHGSRGAAELTSCAPAGPAAPIAANVLLDATELLSGRNEFASELTSVLGSTGRAQCVATRLVSVPEFQQAMSDADRGTISVADAQSRVEQIVIAHRDAVLSACA
jgi:hypothetical protein